MAGHLTIGGLVAFNALVALQAPIGAILSRWTRISVARLVDAERRLEHEPEQDTPLPSAPGRTLEGVTRTTWVSATRPGIAHDPGGTHLEVPPGKTWHRGPPGSADTLVAAWPGCSSRPRHDPVRLVHLRT